MLKDKYEIVIGLEVHAQLSTQTKIFCGDSTVFGKNPNSNVSPISLAHPGTLPKISREAIEYAAKMGLACGSEITRKNIFARKNYFYPDLPKGYQITQDQNPICVGGKIEIQDKEGNPKTIRLHHIHLEEDAGKSLHMEGKSDSFLDYNRAGTPLIEIVTEPDLRSAEEASLFLQDIRRLVRYLGICDGNMEEGSLRCDANVSVRLRGESKLGTRTEIKNLNSFKFIQKAIEFEAERQINLIEKGEKIIQETRNFDPQTGKTSAMRSKENSNDYRYFPEPDLSPVLISDEWFEDIQSKMPTLPQDFFQKFTLEYGLSAYDAQQLIENKNTATYFEATTKFTKQYKVIANWLNGIIKSYLNEHGLDISQFQIKPERLGQLINLIAENKISHSVASQNIFPLMLLDSAKSSEEIAKENDWLLENSAFDLESVIIEILGQFPEKVAEYKKGKKGLAAFFMGELMKKTKGKTDPKTASRLMTAFLEK